MKNVLSASDVIELFLNNGNSNQLKDILELYSLSSKNVGVYLFNEKNLTLQKIDDNEDFNPIDIWYNITSNKIHSVNVNVSHNLISNHIKFISKAS